MNTIHCYSPLVKVSYWCLTHTDKHSYFYSTPSYCGNRPNDQTLPDKEQSTTMTRASTLPQYPYLTLDETIVGRRPNAFHLQLLASVWCVFTCNFASVPCFNKVLGEVVVVVVWEEPKMVDLYIMIFLIRLEYVWIWRCHIATAIKAIDLRSLSQPLSLSPFLSLGIFPLVAI